MNEKFCEMHVKSKSKAINYEKTKGEISKMCMINIEDRDGIEHKAYAWGNLCEDIIPGSNVLATEWVSPEIEKKSDRYIIIKKI